MREEWIFLKSPGNEVDALVFLLNRFQCSDGLNCAKQRVNVADSSFFRRGFRFDFGKCLFGFVDVPSELTDRVKLVIREEGNRFEAVLQIVDSAFFLRIATPCFASVLSHIQIGRDNFTQWVVIRTFDDLLAADRLAQFIQPSANAANGCRDRRNCRPCPYPQIPFDRNRGRGRGSVHQSVRAAKQRVSSAPSAR